MIEPLRLRFDVEHAFATWAQRTSMWWPSSHTVAGEAGVEIVFEPAVGGRIFERAPDGREADWGTILAWEPPRRLVYSWHLRQDRADATEVEIRFDAAPEGGTIVTIEHRGWDRLGGRGPDRGTANERGWAGLLPHYVAAV